MDDFPRSTGRGSRKASTKYGRASRKTSASAVYRRQLRSHEIREGGEEDGGGPSKVNRERSPMNGEEGQDDNSDADDAPVP